MSDTKNSRDYIDSKSYIYLHGLSVLPPGSEVAESEINAIVGQIREAVRIYGPDSAEVKALEDKANEIGRTTERAYLDSLGHDEAAILEKCEALLKTITKAEFDDFIMQQRDQVLPRLQERQAKEKELGDNASQMLRDMNRSDEYMLSEYFNFTFKGAWAFLAGRTYWHQVALMENKIPLAKYEALLDVYATAFYKPKKRRSHADEKTLQAWNDAIINQQLVLQGFFDEPYKKIMQGTPQLMMLSASTKGVKADAITNTATLHISGRGDIQITEFSQVSGELGVSTRKIFDAACARLAAVNPYKPSAGATVQNVVYISLEEYAKANGYDVTPRQCSTPAELDAERERIENALRDVRAILRKDLALLGNMKLTFSDKANPKRGDFYTARIISGYGIRGGTIRINFDTDLARYLTNAYIMNWPTALLLHDNRKPNAYSIGWKLAYHNGLDANRHHGTETRISVAKLLEAAPQIQSCAEMTASGNRNWKRIIKKPLEQSLDDNIAVGYLSRWAYYDGTVELTRDEAASLPWTKYSALMVEFTPAEYLPDDAERLAAKAERITAAGEKKKRGRPRKNK